MPLQIIYLDDEPLLCENFVDCFSTNEIMITTFTDPKVAIEAIAENPPDLIFLDYRLPDTNGDEIAQKLPLDIPKYLITGETTVKTKYKFLKIFHKPYKAKDIIYILSEFLGQKNK